MRVTNLFCGRHALEYAAQTGAQLMRRHPRGHVEPISSAFACALWRAGAEAQIFCAAVDHAALVAEASWHYQARCLLHELAQACGLWLTLASRLALRSHPGRVTE